MKCRIAFILAAAVIAVFWQAGYSGSAPTLTAAMTNYDCGDVNRDGGINILDITFLINYIYKGGPPPVYPHLADVNNSGEINILDITYLINYVYKGGAVPTCPPGPEDPFGSVIGYFGCKTFAGGKPADTIPTNLDCLAYQYDGEGILQLTHINAGFNCCPSSLTAEITIEGDLITIVEAENFDSGGGCYCLCLFDVAYEIVNLLPGEYTISVVELYLQEGDEPLEFTVDLTSSTEGTHCEERDHYPWGFDYGEWGSITHTTGCKYFEASKGRKDMPTDQDCIEYRYDGGDVLSLKHVNAGFNCCPIIQASIVVNGNVITITESETFGEWGPCYCLCLFDVDYEIVGLPPGEYTIKVIELYTDEGDDPLELTVDLAATPQGSFCVYRDHYPWGFDYGGWGRITHTSGCKTYSLTRDTHGTPPDQDCIVYDYDGQNTLSVTHVNAGFNCCPIIQANISVSGDTIMINEGETYGEWGPCACLCLFDVDYEVINIPPGTYTIIVNELCVFEGDDPLEFTIDLTEAPQGNYCAFRDHYPWGYMYNPAGIMTGHSGCGGYDSAGVKDSLPDEDCVLYDYDGQSTLTLQHLNDLFNCCPDTLRADISIEGSVITIDEIESLEPVGGCDCICIYDLDYQIVNLPPGQYVIKVINAHYMNTYGNGEFIEFTIDLNTSPSGSFCVDRPYLPWEGVMK
jgi:hypothetical protein